MTSFHSISTSKVCVLAAIVAPFPDTWGDHVTEKLERRLVPLDSAEAQGIIDRFWSGAFPRRYGVVTIQKIERIQNPRYFLPD